MLIAGFNPGDTDNYSKLNLLCEWYEFISHNSEGSFCNDVKLMGLLEQCKEGWCLCLRWWEAGTVWGVSVRIILRVMKSEIRNFSDMKPQVDVSKKML